MNLDKNKKRKLSEETKAKISASMKRYFSEVQSDEEREERNNKHRQTIKNKTEVYKWFLRNKKFIAQMIEKREKRK